MRSPGLRVDSIAHHCCPVKRNSRRRGQATGGWQSRVMGPQAMESWQPQTQKGKGGSPPQSWREHSPAGTWISDLPLPEPRENNSCFLKHSPVWGHLLQRSQEVNTHPSCSSSQGSLFLPLGVLLLNPFPQLGRPTQPLPTLLIPTTEHIATSPPGVGPMKPCGRSASSHLFIPRDGENSSPGPGMGVVSSTPNIYRISPN